VQGEAGPRSCGQGDPDALGLVYFPFLRGLAHELGNPVMGILGYLRFLNSGGVDPEPAEALRDLESSARRCEELVALLGRCSRPEPSSSTFAPVQVFRDVVSLVQPLARRRDVQMEVHEAEGLPTLSGLPWRLRAGLLGLAGLALVEPIPEGSRLVLALRAWGAGAQVEIGLPARRLDWVRRALESSQAALACAGAARRALEDLGQGVALEERPPGSTVIVSLG